ASLVAYWHWHSLHYGQETYWKGVLGHDLEPGRVYDEVSRTAHELRRVGPVLASLKKKNRVAILYSLDSRVGLEVMPFDASVGYMTVLDQMFRALYRLNVETDFVFPSSRNLADYDLVLVPPLYVASDELLGRLADYVKGGGHVLMAFKSGFADENSTVRWTTMPGPLRSACGFTYREFTNLKTPLPLKGDPYQDGPANTVSVWAEYLLPESAQALAWYDHPVFGHYPAITRNVYGKGTLTYEGTCLSDPLQQKVIAEALRGAGVPLGDAGLPAAVKVKHAVLADGTRVHAYFNFSAKAQTFTCPYPVSSDILSGRKTALTGTISLGPWDLAILRE
ncbi:MAG TPA: beta-galactosidase trimerization domain-containing protein, partial [Burkholderiales bacterium]|nr:beta-galactosidase trimerization domain-containing protein [Burkholderiales bacterium]